jgi:3-hydroxyisobutyrate dehydrogenase-like beta-hydroxyacid dehydrogenase
MARKSRKSIGVIGLGIIGSRVATALRAGGFHVYVWNRTPRVAPNFLSSPAEVADVCDVIQLFVADAHALFEIIDAFLPALAPRHTILCNATVGPEATVEAAKIVEATGAKFLDAPFTGSKTAAERRELVYYIGGSDDVLAQVEPVLRASSKAIIKIGEIGQAATVKIATNMLVAVTAQTLAEALAVVKRSGIDPEAFATALEHHAARSGMSDMKVPNMIRREYEPHFSMKHMFKDVQLAIHIANALDLDIPATTATAGVMYGALNHGWADLDFSALMKVYETEAELAADEEASAAEEMPAVSEAAPGPPPSESKAASVPVEVQVEKKEEPPRESLSHFAPPPHAEPKPAPAPVPSEKPEPAKEALRAPKTDLEKSAEPKPAAPAHAKPDEAKLEEKTSRLAEEKKPSDAAAASVGTKPKGEEPALEKKPEAGATPERVPSAAGAAASRPPFNRVRRWFTARPS